jgi:hypothetical protein
MKAQLYRINQYLKGIHINPRQKNTAVIAYADNVTIFLKDSEGMNILADILTS